jgi:adenine phosphoribosyltransferase
MKDYLQLIDGSTQGNRCDVTPLFAHPAAFAQLVADLCQMFSAVSLDYVAAIDALGFVLGAAMALRLNKGLILIRKGGKLPVETTTAAFVDYSGAEKSLELRKGILRPGDRVLVVDEWIETGAQMQAAIQLIEQQDAVVAGIATINVDSNALTDRLRQEYNFGAIWLNMQDAPEA